MDVKMEMDDARFVISVLNQRAQALVAEAKNAEVLDSSPISAHFYPPQFIIFA